MNSQLGYLSEICGITACLSSLAADGILGELRLWWEIISKRRHDGSFGVTQRVIRDGYETKGLLSGEPNLLQ